MPKFIKKIVFEAIQWDGVNTESLKEFCRNSTRLKISNEDEPQLYTNSGVCSLSKGDWIIRGENGHYHACRSDFFNQNFEALE